MKTKREEKLESELARVRSLLHKEKQRTKDLKAGRDKHKLKAKRLRETIKAQEAALKKNGRRHEHEYVRQDRTA